jgi:hypothetical protein
MGVGSGRVMGSLVSTSRHVRNVGAMIESAHGTAEPRASVVPSSTWWLLAPGVTPVRDATDLAKVGTSRHGRHLRAPVCEPLNPARITTPNFIERALGQIDPRRVAGLGSGRVRRSREVSTRRSELSRRASRSSERGASGARRAIREAGSGERPRPPQHRGRSLLEVSLRRDDEEWNGATRRFAR